MATKERRSKLKGFTLVELVASMTILIMLSVGLSTFLVMSMRANASTRERDVAREAALSQMEILSTADFGVLANADGQTFEVPELNSSTGQTPGLITVDATNPDLIRVDIRVAWSGIQGDQDFELSTLVADTAP